MEYEWNESKNQRNIELRDISFNKAIMFEFDAAVVWDDTRFDYGETRCCALGYIGNRIYQMVFTMRGNTLRVISLRKANKREIKHYAET